MREGLNRLWLVLVLAAFGLPLFIGLGATDLANDEAIYSYAVESVLTTGDWLSPRSSPNEAVPFLEKPPLKFWIVAAPIRLGLLPYNEFGLRFWDALFGALAFAYVFLIGRRLAGPVCGVVAVLLLFAHRPLLLDHGLRSNNMDAALVLAYCGGVYHYLRWSAETAVRARWWQIAAVAGWFFLGFMTKFVGALFLPLVLAASMLLLPSHRGRGARDLWRWVLAGSVVVALVLPWFVYQWGRNGQVIWNVMFGEHVYTRFTAYADPAHLHPWHFYLTEAYRQLGEARSLTVVAVGLLVLLIHTVRRRRAEGAVVLLWLVLPVVCISLGSSKLYHYFYPFLPPLALAGGYGVAWVTSLAREIFARRSPRALAFRWTPSRAVRLGGLLVAVLALVVAAVTIFTGGIRLTAGQHLYFRNTSYMRPLLVAVIGIALAGNLRAALAAGLVILLAVVLPSPVMAYVDNLALLTRRNAPLRSTAECLRSIDRGRRAAGLAAPGVYAPVSAAAFLHPYFYYLRGTGWHADADERQLRDALVNPRGERVVLTDHGRYAAFLASAGPQDRRPVQITMPNVVLLLPGAYEACATAARGSR